MNTTMTIGKRVAMLAATLMGLALLMGGLAIWKLQQINDSVHSLTVDALPGLAAIADVDNNTRWHQQLSWQYIAAPASEHNRIEGELREVKNKITKGLADYDQPRDRCQHWRARGRIPKHRVLGRSSHAKGCRPRRHVAYGH
mgnify:CR=1 FL=1